MSRGKNYTMTGTLAQKYVILGFPQMVGLPMAMTYVKDLAILERITGVLDLPQLGD